MHTRRLAAGLCLVAALAACTSHSTGKHGAESSAETGAESTSLSTPGGPISGSTSVGGTADDTPSRLPTTTAGATHATYKQCGSVPQSTGPLATLARLTLTTPAPGSGGGTVAVTATVSTRSSAPRVVTTPPTSELLILQDGRVLSSTRSSAAAGVPMQLTSGQPTVAQALPKSVRLVGCSPDGGVSDLRAGHYQLVAVLGYRLDNLNNAPADASGAPQPGGFAFVLVSAPATLTVN